MLTLDTLKRFLWLRNVEFVELSIFIADNNLRDTLLIIRIDVLHNELLEENNPSECDWLFINQK